MCRRWRCSAPCGRSASSAWAARRRWCGARRSAAGAPCGPPWRCTSTPTASARASSARSSPRTPCPPPSSTSWSACASPCPTRRRPRRTVTSPTPRPAPPARPAAPGPSSRCPSTRDPARPRERLNIRVVADQGSGRLAAALLDHGASAWGGPEVRGASPGAARRLGPFKRPAGAPPPAPLTAPPLAAPPALMAPAPAAPRRYRWATPAPPDAPADDLATGSYDRVMLL